MLKKDILNKMEKILIDQRQLIIKMCTEQDIEIDKDGDEFDEIQGNLLIGIHNQLIERNALKLNKIDEALKRIKDNTYGLCEDCGEDIPEKRLLFNPYVSTCVDCAEDRELEEKQRKRVLI
jgi:DnaK suppressor protein